MIGSKLEHYEITSHLGSGGMGHVYQAIDGKLGRSVAIKILPEVFARDSDRIARFEREARALASLNHQHIAAIYGLERSVDRTFLVMELVPGDTLADRIARSGPSGLHLDEVLSIARQIAEALEAAHRNGLVHRDLKPANIKITPDGVVKVLDFGLAKVSERTGPPTALSQSPTITDPAMTEAGIILGTAAYMSPEQAKGHGVDKRSDLWAYGSVLYEMLTGHRVFEAADVAETLAAVLMREPDWTRLPANLPRPIYTLLKRCLERDRAKRMSDIAGALFALDEALEVIAAPVHQDAVLVHRRSAYAGWIVALSVTLLAAAAIVSLVRRAPVEGKPMRLQIVTPQTGDPYNFALSPDGSSIVFPSQLGGQLVLRRLDGEEDRPLAGTDRGAFPFWAPDGLSLAFFADGALKRIDFPSGFVRTIASAPNPRPGSWNRAGTILFGASGGPLSKVSAEGGTLEEVTALTPGQASHRFPQFLPDGQRFLFLALGEPKVRGVFLGSLDSKEVTRVVEGEVPFSFLAPRYVVLARQGALWAQTLDLQSGKPQGDLLPIASHVYVDKSLTGLAALSTSSAGSLAYRAAAARTQLVWLNRAGRQIGILGEPDDWQTQVSSISPNERTVALGRTVSGKTDLWLMDITRGVAHRLTSDSPFQGQSIFSPDGSRIVYASYPKGLDDIYERSVDGTGAETLLVSNPENDEPIDWSPDGRYILYVNQAATTDGDIWALPLFGDRKPTPIARTRYGEWVGKFSPDGRWVAFDSDESGRYEIYVQPFPGSGPKVQVSSGGGRLPHWPRKGWEILYTAPDRSVMAVSVNGQGSKFVAEAPRALFKLLEGELFENSNDGQRFLVSRQLAGPSPITLILNWTPPKP
jgi:Tol biopolymer transport system component